MNGQLKTLCTEWEISDFW